MLNKNKINNCLICTTTATEDLNQDVKALQSRNKKFKKNIN